MITFLHLFLLSSLVYWNASSAQKTDGTKHFVHPTGVPPQTLPKEEVNALQDLLKSLGAEQKTPNSSFCSVTNRTGTVIPVTEPVIPIDVTWAVINVTCSCPPGDICHIEKIISSISRVPKTADSSSSSNAKFIPESVGQLTFLKELKLLSMDLQSSIPFSLGKLSHLEYLNLGRNQLTGSIPLSVGDLHSLKELYLFQNFLQGDIPNTLTNLVNLTTLDLGINNLSGPIPKALGNLVMLETLSLYENQLIGSLPQASEKLKKLTELDVSSNLLTGEIPKNFNRLASLQYFDVSGNNMTGKIPNFSNWAASLRYLYLSGNNFEGPLTDEIFKGRNIFELAVSDLKVSNGYYHFPCMNFTTMDYLVLRNCSISGKIPSDIGKLMPFSDLDLSFNNLTGFIPPSLISLNLTSMVLNNNSLVGKIPKLDPRTQVGDFSFNKFKKEGVVPTSENNSTNYFKCCAEKDGSNKVSLKDFTTTPFCNKSKDLTSLHINCGGDERPINGNRYESDNQTAMLHISENWAYSCSGASDGDFVKNLPCALDIPDAALYATARVCPVSLKYYGCLRNGMYDVILHFAEIEYNNNEVYGNLSKRIFDIHIQGNLVKKDFSIVKYDGRPEESQIQLFPAIHVKDHILEIHLYSAGKGSWDNKVLISGIAVTPHKSDAKGLKPLEIAMIAIACVVFFGLVVLLSAWHMGWIGDRSLYEKCIDIQGKKVSIKQLIKATQNFNPKKEIGKGGFGAVYKAQLTGQIIAVKKLSPQSKQGVEEFRRELFTLKSLRHKNFIELFDGYSGHGYHLLIYEYMENKSLADVLFDPNLKLKLNWEVRYKICKDIAAGLKYLHQESHFQMIHGDIKASNMLLDGQYNGKISDFGLAKVYVEDDPSTVVKVGGTTGYMAPEYATQGSLTHKADVYSFGVVLLEIVSGKKNAQYKQQQESEFLLDTAYVLHKKGRIMELVDPDLRECLHEKESHHQAKSLLFLAMMCTSLSPSLRPTMSEVVSLLEGEKTIEQISDDYSKASASTSHLIVGSSSERNVVQKNWTSSDVSPASTDVSSFTTTTYFVIKDKDEKKDQTLPSSTLEISDDS